MSLSTNTRYGTTESTTTPTEAHTLHTYPSAYLSLTHFSNTVEKLIAGLNANNVKQYAKFK